MGHRGSGKTTLIESILFVKDHIKRKGDVENGTTVSDFDKEEIRRIFPINTSLIPVEHNNVKLNFLDTQDILILLEKLYQHLEYLLLLY